MKIRICKIIIRNHKNNQNSHFSLEFFFSFFLLKAKFIVTASFANVILIWIITVMLHPVHFFLTRLNLEVWRTSFLTLYQDQYAVYVVYSNKQSAHLAFAMPALNVDLWLACVRVFHWDQGQCYHSSCESQGLYSWCTMVWVNRLTVTVFYFLSFQTMTS